MDSSIIDEHTGLYNARHLGILLDTEVYRSKRYVYQFSLVCVDLDGLKDLQKSLSYDHYCRLLSELGQAFKSKLTLFAFAFYYGDGEFMVLLPQTAKEEGQLIARWFHRFFKETSWLQGEGRSVQLPARVAVVAFPGDGKTIADLLKAMDRAMYLLKNSSADGVVAAETGVLSPLETN